MNICIVARGVPEKGNGIFEFDQAKALSEYGHDITVIALDLRSIRHKRRPGIFIEKREGLNVVRVNVLLGAVKKKLFYFFAIKAFKKAFGKAIACFGAFDIVHAHFTDNAFIVTKALENSAYQGRVVVTEHSSAINCDVEEIPSDLYDAARFAYENAVQLVSVSKSFSDQIEKNFGLKSRIIPNIADVQLFNYELQAAKKEKIVFVSTGNLNQHKQMDLLIHCFVKAFDHEDKYQLLIIGDGPEQSNLQKQINDLHAQNQIYLLGRKSREEIAEIYYRCDVFALLSKSETFGVAFIEAMAAGLPVLSIESGGPEGFITHECGLISEGDVDSIIQNLKNMVNNITTYDPQRISSYVKKNFSGEAIALQLTACYTHVLEEK